jgi:hypothetical protein
MMLRILILFIFAANASYAQRVINDDLQSKSITVDSTALASRPCSIMTEVQRDALTASSGQCVFNSDKSELNIFDGTTWTPVGGSSQQSFDVLNNASAQELIRLNSDYGSAFIDFELSRSDASDSFAETGRLVMVYKDGLWSLATGLTQGDEMVSSDNPEGVAFAVDNSMGEGILKYSSNNMGASYLGKIKLIITKVRAL